MHLLTWLDNCGGINGNSEVSGVVGGGVRMAAWPRLPVQYLSIESLLPTKKPVGAINT